jgi:outer membrane lipoprotein SlyB
MKSRLLALGIAGLLGGSVVFRTGLGAQCLLATIPEDAHATVWVDDLQRAYGYYVAAHTKDAARADTAVIPVRPSTREDGLMKHFAIDNGQLAKAVSGCLVRAALGGEGGQSAEVIVGRITDANATEAVLEGAKRRLSEDGARIKTINDNRAQGFVAQRANADRSSRHVVVLVHQKRLVLSNDIKAAESVFRQMQRGSAGSLEELPAVRSIRAALPEETRDVSVRMLWYLNPWVAFEQRAESETLQDRHRAYYDAARRHGLTGIVASGGTVVIRPDASFETETLVHAPRPFKSSLQMFDLKPADSLVLPGWLSSDLESVVLLHGNVAEALENMGLVFDDLFAEGIEGTYQEVLEDLKDPEGLNVDLKRDLFPLLGPRVILFHDRAASRTGGAFQPTGIAFEVQDADRVADIVDIVMEGDQEASRVDIAGSLVWKIRLEGDVPDSAIAVALGYAIYANDIRLVRRLLAADGQDAIERQPAFARAKQTLLARRNHDPCMLVAHVPTRRAGPGASDVDQSGPSVADWRSPVDVLFAASWTSRLDVPEKDYGQWWWFFDSAPFLERSRLGLGYLAKDGWSFLTAEFPAGVR